MRKEKREEKKKREEKNAPRRGKKAQDQAVKMGKKGKKTRSKNGKSKIALGFVVIFSPYICAFFCTLQTFVFKKQRFRHLQAVSAKKYRFFMKNY
ncbi:MAG: hypothetical protein IJZ24_02995 [Clostridia bacterium]|nr:hypothetical protein [Clostridia bacterium]